MTRPDSARGIARGLLDALTPALDSTAGAAARQVARDVAQVMGLDGLDAVLAEMQRMHGTARPADLEHVAARIVRLAVRAESEGTVFAFLEADRELASLARSLHETEWSGAGEETVAVYAVPAVLGGLPVQMSADLERSRLAAPVASSLRAALEWIGAEESLVVQAGVHDSALTLTCPVAHEGGLGPAGAVLAACEGSLGPEPDGRWTLRVPLHVERPSYLLLRVGHVPVALPWHAVARLRMLPPSTWANLGEPVLDPPTPLQPGHEERPGALVALGLQRAWFVADRVVWRIAAHADLSHERGPLGSSASVVGVESSERYWVLEPSWLLRGIAPLVVAPPSLSPRHAAAPSAPATAPPAVPAPAPELVIAPELVTAPASEPFSSAPASPVSPVPGNEALAEAAARAIEQLRGEREASASRQMPRPVAPAASPSRELPRPATSPSREMRRPGNAEPPHVVSPQIEVLRPETQAPRSASLPPAPPVSRAASLTPSPSRELPRPTAAAPPAPPAQQTESPSTLRPQIVSARRALVADDSLVARVFLSRLLERRGYVVEAVGDGEGLWEALRRGPWSLVCADATMPDSHGRAHLERLLDFRASSREPFRLIVLTRDAMEETAASESGATLHLRKPFDPRMLDDLLGR